MNNPCINPQIVLGIKTRWIWDVDGMDGDDGDAAVDDGDWCLSLQNRCRLKMDPQRASSPFKSLPKVRFRWFLGVLYVVSPIQFHGAKLFEAAAWMAAIWRELYGRNKSLPPYSYSLNSQYPSFERGFLLESWINSQITVLACFCLLFAPAQLV